MSSESTAADSASSGGGSLNGAFGQLVIGPPGSGKTSYCHAMADYLHANGRPVVLVNLDPANESLPYDAAIDLRELITMEEVSETFQLGPNGGLMYCVEYLEKNTAWLKQKLKQHPGAYFIFDLPGQVELYTHHAGMKQIVERMTLKWGMRLTCVNLIDSHHCSDPSKFLSVLLISLCTMTQLELPHVNLLSKLDLIEIFGELEFGLEFYTDVLDLSYLLPRIRKSSTNPRHPLEAKFSKLNAAMADLIEMYNLVSFLPFEVSNADLLRNAIKLIDKANGYIYVQAVNPETGEGAKKSTTQGQQADESAAAFNQRLLTTAHKTQNDEQLHISDIQERYLPRTTQS